MKKTDDVNVEVVKKPLTPEQKSDEPAGLSMQDLFDWQYRHDKLHPRNRRQERANNKNPRT